MKIFENKKLIKSILTEVVLLCKKQLKEVAR